MREHASPEVVRVGGPPRERGRVLGRELAESIHSSLAFYRRMLHRRDYSFAEVPRLLAEHHAASAASHPDLLEEIAGMAEGADVPFWELFAVNAWEELEPMLSHGPAPSRCTAFALRTDRGTILAHNEQWYAGDAGNVAVVITRPEDGPAFASPTTVTSLPVVGMNARGVALAVMSLVGNDDGVGVPRMLTARSALSAADADEVEQRVTGPNRAGGYGYIVGQAGGGVRTIETAATAHAVSDATAHTNHYLSTDLAAAAPPPDPGSRSRLERLRALLEERRPASPDAAMEILADHESRPQAICRHVGADDEATAVLFSMVCHVEERRMWVAAGRPCETPFREVDLRDLG